MAMEPINLFSRIADPAGVARRLRALVPDAAFDGPDEEWTEAVATFGKGRKKRTLTFTHDPAYYAEPNWGRQMAGMAGYFARFPETARKERVLMLPSSFNFSLGTIFAPDFDPQGDPRLDLLFAIADHLDAVLFTPSSLRDKRGRILFSSDGEEDAEAEWPQVVGTVSMSSPLGRAMHEMSRPRGENDETDAEPPTASRVARRALAMTAVTLRAILEQRFDGEEESERALVEGRAWFASLGIDDELEPDEREALARPLGELGDRWQIDMTWRLEGLAVLAWALGRFDVPPHDRIIDFNGMWRSLGLFDEAAGRALLESPALRRRDEIRVMRNRLFAIHWRLRDFRINRKSMDFGRFARTCSFGPLDIEGLPLVEGDLAIRGERLDRAEPDAVGSAHSTAQERHLAANWLWEGPETYSEASVAT